MHMIRGKQKKCNGGKKMKYILSTEGRFSNYIFQKNTGLPLLRLTGTKKILQLWSTERLVVSDQEFENIQFDLLPCVLRTPKEKIGILRKDWEKNEDAIIITSPDFAKRIKNCYPDQVRTIGFTSCGDTADIILNDDTYETMIKGFFERR